jgi:hypothetical protein
MKDSGQRLFNFKESGTLLLEEDEEEEDSYGYSCYVIHLVKLVVRITMMMLLQRLHQPTGQTNSFRIW